MSAPYVPPRRYPPMFSVRREWTDSLSQAFERAGRTALELHDVRDITFLRDPPQGLKFLRVTSRYGADDTPAFSVESLEMLDIYTRCKREISFPAESRLSDLTVQDRAGLETTGTLSKLESLTVHDYQRGDLGWMPNMGLTELTVVSKARSAEGIRDLSGLRRTPMLSQLILSSLTPATPLDGLDSLSKLRYVSLEFQCSWEGGALDLAPLAPLPLERIDLTCVPLVTSWVPLTSNPTLRRVVLMGGRPKALDNSPLDHDGLTIL
ncbi:MAG TPA: hypothetical protein PKV13_13770 [Propionicimonas sp.]|nr:hypothetical protein [Propionicimonas sp.]